MIATRTTTTTVAMWMWMALRVQTGRCKVQDARCNRSSYVHDAKLCMFRDVLLNWNKEGKRQEARGKGMARHGTASVGLGFEVPTAAANRCTTIDLLSYHRMRHKTCLHGSP